jgi:hypothetical protein
MLCGLVFPFALLFISGQSPRYGRHVSVGQRTALRYALIALLVGTIVPPIIVAWRIRRERDAVKAGAAPKYGGASEARIGLAAFVLGVTLIGFVLPSGHGPRWSMWAAGDMRTMVSAQAVYQSATRGYGTIDCLVKPESCIPDYKGPTFLGPEFLQEERHMHRFTFRPAPPVDGKIQQFTYTANPVDPEVSPDALCADETGVICLVPGVLDVQAKDGRCPSGCRPL